MGAPLLINLLLVPETHGNRPADVFGNVHSALDHRGLIVIRHPGRYIGRHRR